MSVVQARVFKSSIVAHQTLKIQGEIRSDSLCYSIFIIIQTVNYTAVSAHHGKNWTCEAYTDVPSLVLTTDQQMNILCKFTSF